MVRVAQLTSQKRGPQREDVLLLFVPVALQGDDDLRQPFLSLPLASFCAISSQSRGMEPCYSLGG